jgi:PAS domain S-box-containing protein
MIRSLAARRLNPPAILFAGTDAADLATLGHCLADEGFRVVTSDDAESFLDIARSSRPDLVLLDAVTPDRGGFERCRDLKAATDLADTPVVFVLSVDKPADRGRCLHAGAVDFVFSPIDPVEVLTRVRRHCRCREATGERGDIKEDLNEATVPHPPMRRRLEVPRPGGGHARDANDDLGAEPPATPSAPDSDPRSVEAELFASREMLRLVLDTIPQRVFWKDTNLVYLGCNLPLARDCGYDDPKDLIGKTDYETSSAATADLYRADDRHVVETGTPKLRYEEPQTKPDGSQAWLMTSKVPLRDLSGHIIGVLGTYEDITELKRTQLALRKSESFLNNVIDNIPLVIFVKDAKDLRFVRFNKAGEDLLGFSRDELLGKTDSDVFPPDVARFFREGDLRTLTSGNLLDIAEETIQTKDSGCRTLHTRKIPILDHEGQPLYLLGISEDITDRKRAESERTKLEEGLRQAQKMESVGLLAGGIAHDLNNLLSPIIGYSELLQLGLVPEDRRHEYLGEIRRAGERACELTRQLLAFSRRQVLALKVLHLGAVVRHLEPMLR